MINIEDWKAEAERLRFDEHKTYTEIAEALQPMFPGVNAHLIYKRVSRLIPTCPRYKAEHHIQVKPKVDKPAKIEVVQNLVPETLNVLWKGNTVVRFGLMGDPQINSKYTQITYLHKFYDVCAAKGITHVYNTGDMDEGEDMRKGHKYECYNQGADDHVKEIVRVYPKCNGITTHFITGNHDASMVKSCGYDIGYAIEKERPDMQYLGRDCARIKLTPNCILELRHPWDMTAYALSYKLQKMVEALEGGTKPNILAVGHYHKAEYFVYRNVHCFQTACFQAQTPFERGKGISIQMGGWIIEIEVDENGYIQRIKPEFVPFYTSIPDDYKNWRE